MPRTAKLNALKKRFGEVPEQNDKPASGPRVQKNLSILKSDAARIAKLAKRARISQAQLLSAALDSYERHNGLDKRNKAVSN